jgi:hypothetical protein
LTWIIAAFDTSLKKSCENETYGQMEANRNMPKFESFHVCLNEAYLDVISSLVNFEILTLKGFKGFLCDV